MHLSHYYVERQATRANEDRCSSQVYPFVGNRCSQSAKYVDLADAVSVCCGFELCIRRLHGKHLDDRQSDN